MIRPNMYTIEQSLEFKKWFDGLRDELIKLRLTARLIRAENGNFGDYKIVDGQLLELRMTFGGGIRIYFTIRNGKVILLLRGGDKSTQQRDITKAKRLLAELED